MYTGPFYQAAAYKLTQSLIRNTLKALPAYVTRKDHVGKLMIYIHQNYRQGRR